MQKHVSFKSTQSTQVSDYSAIPGPKLDTGKIISVTFVFIVFIRAVPRHTRNSKEEGERAVVHAIVTKKQIWTHKYKKGQGREESQ